MISNAVPPSVTPPSPNEWLNTVKNISGITNASQAIIHSAAHGFTMADVFITSIMVKQVAGMLPINGMNGVIQSIIDADNYSVNINTTQFPIYRSGGVTITDTGEPPVEQQGTQFFNTPWQNIATTF